MKKKIIPPLMRILLLEACSGIITGREESFTSSPYRLGTPPPHSEMLGHISISFDWGYKPGAYHPLERRPARAFHPALEDIMADMDDLLDSLGVSTNIAEFGEHLSGINDVSFGCETYLDERGEQKTSFNKIKIVENKSLWKERFGEIAAAANVRNVMVIKLGFGEYTPRRTGLVKKEVHLGTGYTIPVPFLTDTDTPVEVLHVTGMIVGRDGDVLCAAAEGIVTVESETELQIYPLPMAMRGRRIMIPDEVLDDVWDHHRRNDLPGEPLQWRVAMQNLVAHLTGRFELLMPKQ